VSIFLGEEFFFFFYERTFRGVGRKKKSPEKIDLPDISWLRTEDLGYKALDAVLREVKNSKRGVEHSGLKKT